MTAREDVLARVRAARATDAVTVPRDYRAAGSEPGSVALFVDRLLDYKAAVHRCSEATIAETVQKCLTSAGSVLRPDGLPPEWTAGASVVLDDPPLSTEALDAVGAVVTTARIAIAETGTIILDHGPGQGRRAVTLVPDHHVVVVRRAQIVASVPDAVASLRTGAMEPGAIQTWVSGPSATSDIELSRVEGVHGPRRLDVVIVE